MPVLLEDLEDLKGLAAPVSLELPAVSTSDS